jgi:hypothetical protein
MDVDQERRAEQLYHQLGLEPMVNKLLKDFPDSLSGVDRTLEKIFGPYDIKGRVHAVAKLAALIAHITASEKYDQEVVKLEALTKSLATERDNVRNNYDSLVQKVSNLFDVSGKESESQKIPLASGLEANYEELRVAIATLVEVIPYDEIREKSGQALFDILQQDSRLKEILKDSETNLAALKQYLEMAVEKGAAEASRYAVNTLSEIMRNKIFRVRTELTLYTKTDVLCGSVYHLEGERLSDLLNDESDPRGYRATPFLEISNVDTCDPKRENAMLPIAHIKKATIQIIILPDTNAARGVGAKPGFKSFPFLPKLRIPVEVKLRDYSIVGNIHCAAGQLPQNVLDDTPKFLSLTDASVLRLNENTRLIAPFVAINKDQILALTQEEISLGFSDLLAEYYMKLLKLGIGLN